MRVFNVLNSSIGKYQVKVLFKHCNNYILVSLQLMVTLEVRSQFFYHENKM